MDNVHTKVHVNFHPESRVKSLEYRDKILDIKSIDQNDINDKYDINDKVTFSSESKIINNDELSSFFGKYFIKTEVVCYNSGNETY